MKIDKQINEQGKSCRICLSERIRIYSEKQIPLAAYCDKCGHLQFMGEEIPSKNDGDEFSAYLYAQDEKLELQRRTEVLKTLLKLTQNILPYAKLLDIGSGSGKFAAMAKKSGFYVTANEISEAAAAHIERHFRIPVLLGYIRNTERVEEFSAVTMFCVLAHVTNVQTFLNKVNDILEKDGILYLHTPRFCLIDRIALNLISMKLKIGYKILKRRVNWEHKNIFTNESISILLTNSDFEIIDMDVKIGYGLKKRFYFNSMGVPKYFSRILELGLNVLEILKLLPRNVLVIYAKKSA